MNAAVQIASNPTNEQWTVRLHNRWRRRQLLPRGPGPRLPIMPRALHRPPALQRALLMASTTRQKAQPPKFWSCFRLPTSRSLTTTQWLGRTKAFCNTNKICAKKRKSPDYKFREKCCRIAMLARRWHTRLAERQLSMVRNVAEEQSAMMGNTAGGSQ